MSDGATPVRIYGALRAAHVFSKRTEIEFELLKVEDATIAIGGIAPDPRLDRRADPLEGVEYKTPQADVAILLFHCGFEGNTPPGFAEAILPKSRVAAMKGIDYFFLGDIHSTHKSMVGGSTIIVPGATERLNFGELKSKPGFYYAELDGKNAVKLTHQTIEPQPMRRETIRTTNIPADLPSEYIFERLHEWSAKDQLMQLRIEGPIQREVYHHLCFFDIWRLGDELNFYFDLDRAGITLEREKGGVSGGGESISIRREIERVATELASERDGDERTLIDEARDMVLGRLVREE